MAWAIVRQISYSKADKKIVLPYTINEYNKYRMAILGAILTTVIYLLPNHFHLFEPTMLQMSWIDQVVSFVPWTIWIYVSEVPLFLIIYAFIVQPVNLNRYVYSFMFLQLASSMIFWLWPTTFPRGDYPLPTDLDALTFHLFSFIRTADTPANCAPSLHVSSVYLASFCFLEEQREKFPFFFCWATAVAVSTITTKQHYFIDVVLGFGMAVLVYALFKAKVELVPNPKLKSKSV